MDTNMHDNNTPEICASRARMEHEKPWLSIFGLGYVGAVSTACFAGCGHRVIGVDSNTDKVDFIKSGVSPIAEAGLGGLLREGVRRDLVSATEDVGKAVLGSEVSLICVGTPSAADGSCDISDLRAVSHDIGAALARKNSYHLIVFRSTIPPGTTREHLLPIIEAASGKRCGEHFGLCFHPEFLREGTAIADFYDPAKTVVGAFDQRSGEALDTLYSGIDDKLIHTTIEVAEMIKYVDNTWHALKVSFANEIGKICLASCVDSHAVMDIFVQDTKLNISPYYLKPGFAFGGSCLPKDVRGLDHLAKTLDVETPIIDSILPSNQAQIDHAVSLIGRTAGRCICFLGVTFKAGTDDLRESPTLSVIAAFLQMGCGIRIFDPNVDLEVLARHHVMLSRHNQDATTGLMGRLPDLVCTSVSQACDAADTIVVSHNNPLFRDAVATRPDSQKVVDLVRLFDPQGSLARIFASGMNDYLQKPARGDDVLQMLTQWTGEGHAEELRILLAEDDCAMRDVTKAILQKAGYRIDTVGDGSLAVQACEKRHFDAVLMGISMPEMDGFEAALAIRSLPGSRPELPIIALTALAVPEQSRTYSGICW